jgi:hypothetical protein
LRVSFDVACLPRQQRSLCASFFIFFSDAPKGPKSGSSLSAQIAQTHIARTHIRTKKRWEEKTSGGHDAHIQSSDVFFFFWW